MLTSNDGSDDALHKMVKLRSGSKLQKSVALDCAVQKCEKSSHILLAALIFTTSCPSMQTALYNVIIITNIIVWSKGRH